MLVIGDHEINRFILLHQRSVGAYSATTPEKPNSPGPECAPRLRGDCERSVAAGMDDYISKPVKSEDLLAVIKRWAPAPSLSYRPLPRLMVSPGLQPGVSVTG